MLWQSVLYFLLWAGAFAVMMRFGCRAQVMGHGGRDERPSGEPGGGLHVGGGAGTPEMAVDPVCGMTVQTAEAKSAVYQAHAYYFCSQNCREKFQAAPAMFTTPGSFPAQPQEHHHGSCC